MCTKSWSIGPVSLWVNQDDSDKACRGHAKEEGKGKEEGLLTWLDSKKRGICSLRELWEHEQVLFHTTYSGHDFIWVVRKIDEGATRVFLEEFEKRVQESSKGYLIWGWAPQLVILEHPVTGGVVTHCGINTVFESVIASLPMVTWPIYADQFFNEKLLVDVLRIGGERMEKLE
ncbi:hypothetical protein JHK82_056092 [Glycine max]|nr:hypothetical protein JHK86_055918 [Glycine max]KAG5074731.1 hypothetical protein JHK84_055962 [Glycine max]KAG5077397.1 hypothetical protein JHK82_056092 [Glycine max]